MNDIDPPACRDADAAYYAKLTRARHMLAALDALLKHHATAQEQDKANWGLVGDLTALCKTLGEAATCITKNA